jgi:pilus assembly protein Flp/PilA
MMNYRNLWNSLLSDESGQDLIEYALVAALIGLAAIAGMQHLATSISSAFNSVGNSLTSAV